MALIHSQTRCHYDKFDFIQMNWRLKYSFALPVLFFSLRSKDEIKICHVLTLINISSVWKIYRFICIKGFGKYVYFLHIVIKLSFWCLYMNIKIIWRECPMQIQRTYKVLNSTLCWIESVHNRHWKMQHPSCFDSSTGLSKILLSNHQKM